MHGQGITVQAFEPGVVAQGCKLISADTLHRIAQAVRLGKTVKKT